MDVAGLVSSIITFVDFSWTIVRGTYDVYNSASGGTEENIHIGHVLEDLGKATNRMRSELTGQDAHEKALLELQYQCQGLSHDLAVILQKLTTKRHSGLQSLNIMLKSLMNEKEVRGIEKRLSEYRSQMILRLNLILLERTVIKQDSARLAHETHGDQLRHLVHKAAALPEDNSVLRRLYFDGMYRRAEEIVDATDGTFDWLLADANGATRVSSDGGSTGRITSKEGSQCGYYYQLMPKWIMLEHQERQQNSDKLSTFVEYGGGVFFLRGKPGSGKSALMKYLTGGRGHPRIHQKLLAWAGQKRLVCVTTLFLLHGIPLQRSLEGFYRTFFFELLCQCPEFIHTLFPRPSKYECLDDSYSSSIRLEILRTAWSKFISFKIYPMLRICVFIDGLDELEGNSGDRLKFAQVLDNWAHSEDIKIICSGRPNAEFNQVFDQPHQRIDLQVLTKSDIRKILTERLTDKRLGPTILTKESTEGLIADICNRSEGVILWAVLVGKSLEDDIAHRKPLQSLRRTVTMSPPGIVNLFQGMWHDIRHDARHQLMLRTIYEILALGDYDDICQPLAVYLSWLDDVVDDKDFPYNRADRALSDEELSARLDQVKIDLVLYTKHLVEVVDEGSRVRRVIGRHFTEEIRFVHRSAKEFIESMLGLIGPISAPNNQTFEMYLRFRLMFELSVHRPDPVVGAQWMLFTAHYYRSQNWKNTQKGPYQIPYRILERLCQSMEFRNSFVVSSDYARAGYNPWFRRGFVLTRDRQSWNCASAKRPLSLFDLALRSHQVDYVTRNMKSGKFRFDVDVMNFGIITCAIGTEPSHELFKLLVDHGADPDTLVEVFLSERENVPRLVPLWLVFCFLFASTLSGWLSGYWKFPACLKADMWDTFLILEHFLRLGRGANIQFLATTDILESRLDVDRNPTPGEDRLFGMDLAQVVRVVEPDNMHVLLLLLESPPTSYLVLMQRLINGLLHPQFPFRDLPQGAETMPYKKVSDDYLMRTPWVVWSAFDAEHEITGNTYYFTI
ncbi:hypothetical protein Daus18300_010866 [Diaporthe australafricana]|uniref:Nephrocystin 3-like N-terminal domain-containing protein n=1 Tax=Diaporthe australafricana TaxID=127596 RepID=A0ABR3W8H2_9PEZI